MVHPQDTRDARRWFRRWRPGLIAAVAMTLLALYPQFSLWYERGGNWNGSYAYFDTDEVAYSAYLQALIDGRARRNDPYTGRDDQPGVKQPESLFSIQFVTPYAIASFARIFGINASTSFILLIALAAFGSTLAIFWLIASVTNDERVAAVGAIVVLCLGILVNGQGAARVLFAQNTAYSFLPFLRRYIPAASFPFYFAFCALVWRSLTSGQRRASLLTAILAGVVFANLVFSYFYLWTTALAWLACLALLWLVARPEGYREALKSFGVIIGLACAALVPYFLLLSNRAATMDAVQALTRSHAPDLFQPPELVGLAVVAALFFALRRGIISWRDKTVLFTASFALVPLVVFNQQIITGRSLQPIHYAEFIANYVALVGVVLAAWLIRRERVSQEEGDAKPKRRSRGLVLIAAISFSWGIFESKIGTELFLYFNLMRDETWIVSTRLAQIGRNDPNAETQRVVFAPNLILADSLPTVAPQPVLWSPHMHVFSGVTIEENKERFYQYLYYTNVGEQQFAQALSVNHFYYLLAIFGWERANPVLALSPKPITPEERQQELRVYLDYVDSFNRERASRPLISYVVVSSKEKFNFTNLDRWYERDEGERVGDFILYRVKLR